MLPKVVFIVILTDACSSSIQPPSPSPAKPGPKVCPLAWAQYEDRCYWLMREAYSWLGARQTCQVLYGAELASVHTDGEGTFIKLLSEQNDVWLGGVFSNEEQKWIWTDKTTFDYEQPGGENVGKCTSYGRFVSSNDWRSGFKIRTRWCSSKLFALCSKMI